VLTCARPLIHSAAMEAESLPDIPFGQWLSAKAVGAHFSLNEESVYRWRGQGMIPDRFVRFRSKRNFLFHPLVIDHLKTFFARANSHARKVSPKTV